MAERLPPLVRGLGLVSLLNDLASEMVYPLLPAFLTRNLGAGALALGALDGLSDAVSAGVKVGAGWLSDRPGWRKPLVLSGYALAAVTRPLMAGAGAAWQVVALRAADRLGKGARTPPRDALIADAVQADLRGRAFGFHRGMDHAGAMLGPLVASALIAAFALSPQTVIAWSIVPGVLVVLAAGWVLRDGGRSAGRSRDGGDDGAGRGGPEGGGSGVEAADAPRALLILILLFAFFRVPEALLLLRLQELGLPVAAIPLAWAGLHALRSATSYGGGGLADRMGHHRVMVVGWLLYGFVCGYLSFSRGPVSGVLSFLGFGLVSSLTEAPERALVAAWAGRRARGRGFGWFHAGLGLAALPGGLLLGALYQALGGEQALRVSAASGIVLFMLGRWIAGPLPDQRAGGTSP